MAILRQIRKQILTIASLVAVCAGLCVAAAATAGPVVTAIVTDPLSGIAIDGYDPVTYFTDPVPQKGKPDHEYYWGGVPWYFATAANRDAFVRAPDVYAPQYGGYCLMSLARGFLSVGKPGIFAISGGRLFLFYSTANRDAFMLARGEATTSAKSNWATLSPTLVSARQ